MLSNRKQYIGRESLTRYGDSGRLCAQTKDVYEVGESWVLKGSFCMGERKRFNGKVARL